MKITTMIVLLLLGFAAGAQTTSEGYYVIEGDEQTFVDETVKGNFHEKGLTLTFQDTTEVYRVAENKAFETREFAGMMFQVFKFEQGVIIGLSKQASGLYTVVQTGDIIRVFLFKKSNITQV